LRIATVIRDTYAGEQTSWSEIAGALGVSERNPVNRYPLWSAVAYGLVLKHDDNTYSLGETGRKILAPTYDGEREEGIKKALFTPSVLSRFYTDYNGSTIPSDDLFPNVLEDTLRGAPRKDEGGHRHPERERQVRGGAHHQGRKGDPRVH
jgi:hypothetical protein